MTPIQIILLACISVLGLVYQIFLRSKILNRLLFATTFLVGIIFVLVPNLTNRIAHFFGVGRGADLLLYTMVIFFYAAFIFLYSRIRKIEIMQTEITRANAIQNAGKPKKEGEEHSAS